LKFNLANKKSISLSILPLSSITPHEDTLPGLVESLEKDMKRTRFQRDPVIVDKKTRVALDGMHRLAALESLGSCHVMCTEFDYMNDSIKLGRWLRFLIAPDPKLVRELVNRLGMIEQKNLAKAIANVDSGEYPIALLSRGVSYICPSSSARDDGLADSIISKIRMFDRTCKRSGQGFEYAPDTETLELFASQSVFVLYHTSFTKQDVLDTVKRGNRLPMKTTRHILPYRPMGVNFPLDDLLNSTLEHCDSKLNQIVRDSDVRLEREEVWYEGRRYAEPLIIFSHISE
jgi:hypothetical protein